MITSLIGYAPDYLYLMEILLSTKAMYGLIGGALSGKTLFIEGA